MSRRRWALIGGAVLATAAIVGGAFNLRYRFEQAAYEVIEERPEFELRRYAPRIVAEVDTVASDPQQATSEGFRVLADYIFGNNIKVDSATVERERSSMTIAMTTPVDRIATDGTYTIRFTLPSEYALADLPKPVNPRIRLVELAPATAAVVRLSGDPSEQEVQEGMQLLLDDLRRAGLRRSAREPIFARYDPPWTPWFLERNEVIVELQTSSDVI